MKKVIVLCIIFSLILTLIPTSTVQAAIKINKKTITIEIGETFTLKITGTNSAVKWTSSDPDIATVSKSGKVTGVYYGQAKITAKVKNKTYSCVVNVWPENLDITLYESDNIRLSYFNVVEGWAYFNVTNKTDEQFSIADEYIIIDGITYPGSGYCSDVPPNYTKAYAYDTVSDIDKIINISGKFKFFGNDVITIEEFDFKDIEIN